MGEQKLGAENFGKWGRLVLAECKERGLNETTTRKILQTFGQWLAAPAPSDESGSLIRSVQEKRFVSIGKLVDNLLSHVGAGFSRYMGNVLVDDLLDNFEFYLPSLRKMLRMIESILNFLLKNELSAQAVRGYFVENVKLPYGPLAHPKLTFKTGQNRFDLQSIFIAPQLEALYRSFAMIHIFASFLMQQKLLQRPNIEKKLGGPYRVKGSKFDLIEDNPKIREAREEGLSLWAGFSGSTADVLSLGREFGLSQSELNQLAAVAVAFFSYMPTDQTPTHTLHEVLSVANAEFDVPYHAQWPERSFPHLHSTRHSTSGGHFTISKL